MSREIKFRGWYEFGINGHQMRDVTEIKYLIRKGVRCHLKGGGEVSLDEVMQYTGFKDKNGVEVYEGDVVKFGNPRETFSPLESPGHCAEVTYHDGIFNLDGYWVGDVTNWHKCEVIGNIYENGQLLKGGDAEVRS